MKVESKIIIDVRSLLIKQDLQKLKRGIMRQDTKLYGDYEAPDYFKKFDWLKIGQWAALIGFIAICLALIGYDINVDAAMNGDWHG